jgi:hypothetical protein
LQSENGFLAHYHIESNQRILFCAGFGGITGFIGRFESADNECRNFHASDCEKNEIVIGENRALVKSANGDSMWIGSSFPADISTGSAVAMQTAAPAAFLASEAGGRYSACSEDFSSNRARQSLRGFSGSYSQ